MRELAPNWSVKEEIQHVKGHVGIMMTSDDVNTPPEEAFENVQRLLEAGNTKVRAYAIPGEHADSWMDARELHMTPEDFKVERYLTNVSLAQKDSELL